MAAAALADDGAPITARELLDGLSTSAGEYQNLENGEVLAYDGESYEKTKRVLAADAAVLVHKDLSEIKAFFHENESLIPVKDQIDHAEIFSEADFASVAFTDTENDLKEVEDLLAAKPGKDFNFSAAEYELLKKSQGKARKADKSARVQIASDFIREVMIGRYRLYQENGLAGITPYQRSSRKHVEIGNELKLTNEAFAPFEPYFPDFYDSIVNFPADNGCCRHEFRWLKVKLRKRPSFVLAHTIYQLNEHYLLITERFYYISNTANTLQVTMSWLHYEDDTYMGLTVSASADILDSMMGRMLRPLGRNKAREMVTELMTDFRDELNDDPAESDDQQE
jgi:hypothetical protein